MRPSLARSWSAIRSRSCRNTRSRRCPKQTRFNNSDPYWYTNPVGTGPYKFVQYAEDQYIEYARNDEWWGGKVGPEKLFMKISSPEVAMIALEKGELDYMYPTNLSEIKRLQTSPNIDLIEAKNSAQFFGLIPNYTTMNGAWRDPKIKQALLKSVDRQAYVKTILQGYGAVRNSPFDGSAYACPTMIDWSYDPVEADKLWTEAGWPKEKRGEWVMDFMSWLGNKPRLDYLPILQEAVRKMGFKANVDLIDNSLITDYLSGKGPRGKDYDTQVLLWGPGADPQGMAFLSDPTSKTNSGVWGCPDSWNPDIPMADFMKTCWKYENRARLGAVRVDCQGNRSGETHEVLPGDRLHSEPGDSLLHDGRSLLHPEQEQAAAGCRLAERRQPGLVDADVSARRPLALAAVVLAHAAT